MINLTDIVNKYWLFVNNFIIHGLVLNIPKIYGCLICSYPLFKEVQIVYSISIIFRYCLLSLEIVCALPKCQSNSIYYGPDSLISITEGNRKDSYLMSHVFVSFRNYLSGFLKLQIVKINWWSESSDSYYLFFLCVVNYIGDGFPL